jgi:uncharacterized protein DUF2617
VLIRLDLPYADVRAGDLCLILGGPARTALEVLRAEAAGWTVELRLLGSSHQALVAGGVELSETVACAPGGRGPLPARRRGGTVSGAYTFTARVERLTAGAYLRRALATLGSAAADPLALAGVFPAGEGDPGPAFTALQLRPLPRGATWTTWHGYPQTGELVVTTSRVERRV